MQNKLAFISIVALSLLLSCKDDDFGFKIYKCKTCVTAPEAIDTHDNTGRGIYKGAVIGSSGSIKFNIENNDATITATLTLDGISYALTTSDSYDNATGFSGDFVGTMVNPNDISLTLNVSNTGFAEVGTMVIPGHDDVKIELMKERSEHLVAIYEGSFFGTASGIWNIALRVDVEGNGNWQAVMRPLMGDVQDDVHYVGAIVVTELTGADASEAFAVTGNIIKDNISGGWQKTGFEIGGTWTGKRTL